MKKELIGDLIFDSTIYNRHDVDRQHVQRLKEAIEAGQELPPLIVCKKTKKIIDGVHRWYAFTEFYGDEAQWYIQWENFTTDKQRFLRSVEINAKHGLKLSKYDRAHCYVIAERLHISVADLASGLGIKETTFTDSIKQRFASSAINEAKIPLKRTIQHMADHEMTEQQMQVNESLSGWSISFHAEQIIRVVRNDLLDKDNEDTMNKLRELLVTLQELLTEVGV